MNFLNEDTNIYNNTSNIKFDNLQKYNLVIIGEQHGRHNIQLYEKLIETFKPEYFIAEFADTDRCLTQEELKYRLDHPTNGDWSMKVGADYQYNYWLYDICYKYHLKLIGCNPITTKRFKTMQEEVDFREPYMLRTIQDFEKYKCIVQLGDFHLRSIPNSKEFIKFCGEEDKDDRGICENAMTLTSSPVWDKYHYGNIGIIYRIKENYEKEKEFEKLQ